MEAQAMKLVDVYYDINLSARLLFDLLGEREPAQSISHKAMPDWEDHYHFVSCRPYEAWYLIEAAQEVVGACYLSKQREIGIFLFREWQMKGFGAKAVEALMKLHPGRFLANVAPTNPGSSEFFQNLGFKHIQNTYALEAA